MKSDAGDLTVQVHVPSISPPVFSRGAPAVALLGYASRNPISTAPGLPAVKQAWPQAGDSTHSAHLGASDSTIYLVFASWLS